MANESYNSGKYLPPFQTEDFSTFFRTAPFGVSLVDCKLRYLYVNEKMAALNGRPAEEHIGRKVGEIRPEISLNEELLYRRVMESGEPLFDVQVKASFPDAPDQARYWNLCFYPILTEVGILEAVATSIRDKTEVKSDEMELNERLRFEALLSRLSTIFVNLPSSEVDSKICDSLESITEFLGFQRGVILEFSSDQTRLLLTHQYNAPGSPVPPTIDVNEVLPNLVKSFHRGLISFFSSLDELPDSSRREKEYLAKNGLKSTINIPLKIGETILGGVSFSSTKSERRWPEDIIRRLKLVGEIFASALERKRVDQRLEKTFSEIKRLKDHLEAENLYLRDEIEVLHSYEEIVGQSKAIRRTLNQIEQVAGTSATVLLTGETGTGKELLARAIHKLSSRKLKKMVKVNCAALPASLIEGELFGREKGAYTGALTKQIGRFETAHGGTIFLDEIGELPLELQAKLLRVLQDGQFEHLGSSQTIHVDVRVIAASNRDLAQAVREEKFRADLFYRLNVFPVSVPPLRQRQEDIPLMVWAFVKEFAEAMGKIIEKIPKADMEACRRYAWPGNVRELRNVIERAMILCKGTTLRLELPGSAAGSPGSQSILLCDVERRHILAVLKSTGWRIRGKGGAAEILALKPTTLDAKIKKLGIKKNTSFEK